jgi:hypothetical protein
MNPPTPLTPKQVNNVMQQVTMTYLGIAPTDPQRFAKVRVGWQQQGEPAFTIAEDVVIITVVEDDDPYNRIRDFEYVTGEADTAIEITTYTRVWRINWQFWGPNSFDHARMVRSGLYTQKATNITVASNLYCVMDIPAPRRLVENDNGQWWERVDFSCQFNEAVTEAPNLGLVTSVEVIVNDAATSITPPPLIDVTVTP